MDDKIGPATTMSQVFISYAHVNPDQQHAATLCRFLETNGFEVFVDSKIRLGEDWVEQIDVQLRRSQYFVALLSEASVKSDMVRREIAIAYKLRKEKKLTIFPVRVAFEGELPYEVSAYLDLIQYIVWKNGESFDPICRAILESMGKPYAPVSASSPFSESDIERVKRELARHLGPMARVIVDRAIPKAGSWRQLYELLAAEIPAGKERNEFLATRPH